MVCVIYNKEYYEIFTFFHLTFEVSRIPQRILGILSKEISQGGRGVKGDRPGQEMLLGKLKKGVGGCSWKEDNSSSCRKGNIWPGESGGWGKKRG